MSTKIYDAYKLKGDMEVHIHSLMNLLKAIRDLHQKTIKTTYFAFHRTVFKESDFKGIIEKDETLQSLGSNFMGDYILEQIIRKIIEKGRNEPMNVDASAVVYFHEKNVYVKFFGLTPAEDALVHNAAFLEDYHYQNSVDQSNYDWKTEKWEEMSEARKTELERDWEERRETWDKLIGDGPFYENGLIFNFVPSGYPMTLLCQEILKPFKPTKTQEDV